MNETELTPVKERIKGVLGDRIDDETLDAELDRYINQYHVSLDAAARGIIRKFTKDDAGATAFNVTKKIADLNGTEQSVDILAKIVYVDTKEITVKGLNKTIVSGILGDDSGTASFTVWEPGSVKLDKGSVYNFRNCYCKLWNERVQVNIGNRGKIEAAPGTEIDVPDNGSSLTAKEVRSATYARTWATCRSQGRSSPSSPAG